MLRVTLSYLIHKEKKKFLADMENLKEHKVLKISKDKGISLHRKIYISLFEK